MDHLGRLTSAVSGIVAAELPASTIGAAKTVVLDTLGAILAGSRLEENARLARLVAERSPGAATLLGQGARAEPMLAALANATAGVALEVDEGTRLGGGHPAIHVLPPLLAVAEEAGADGGRLIEGLVAGYEIASRLGAATVARPNVHSHGTWGTPAAAAAVATLGGADALALREVVSLAASMSPANSWTPCFEGATVRNLYPGRAALTGILAVHAHRAGFTGLQDGPADVYGTILGERFDPASLVDDLGRPWRIERGYVKLHACCLFNHPALDAVAALAAEGGFGHADVEHVTVTTIPFAARMTDPEPPNRLAAKFSIPYAIAARLVTGRSDLAAFEDAVREDPRVRALAATIEVRTDPAMSMRRSDAPTAIVQIALRDGRRLERATTVVRGDALDPAPPERVLAKFLALAEPVLGARSARAVVERVERLEELKDVRDLTALLAGAPRG